MNMLMGTSAVTEDVAFTNALADTIDMELEAYGRPAQAVLDEIMSWKKPEDENVGAASGVAPSKVLGKKTSTSGSVKSVDNKNGMEETTAKSPNKETATSSPAGADKQTSPAGSSGSQKKSNNADDEGQHQEQGSGTSASSPKDKVEKQTKPASASSPTSTTISLQQPGNNNNSATQVSGSPDIDPCRPCAIYIRILKRKAKEWARRVRENVLLLPDVHLASIMKEMDHHGSEYSSSGYSSGYNQRHHVEHHCVPDSSLLQQINRAAGISSKASVSSETSNT
ncbi:unnamed protein product [Amoebophrya sp. A25]|nr:unnamed protein product [Amoebophrya sp. A25]|eukprot:GSA25T00023292001.1